VIRLDDELEQLTLSVLDVFGEDALIAAIRCATTTALRQKGQPIDVLSPVGASGVMSTDDPFTSMSAFFEVVVGSPGIDDGSVTQLLQNRAHRYGAEPRI
jgi:hypothetical protein